MSGKNRLFKSGKTIRF